MLGEEEAELLLGFLVKFNELLSDVGKEINGANFGF